VIPDRVDGAANGRDVVGVGENSVLLFGYPHPAEFARQVGEVDHFDAGDVVEIAGIVAIAAIGATAPSLARLADKLNKVPLVTFLELRGLRRGAT
jgi:hypothetical protein